MTRSRFHTEDTQVLGGSPPVLVYSLVNVVTWLPGFVHLCTRVFALAGKVLCPYAESCYEEIKIGVVFVPESIPNICGLS